MKLSLKSELLYFRILFRLQRLHCVCMQAGWRGGRKEGRDKSHRRRRGEERAVICEGLEWQVNFSSYLKIYISQKALRLDSITFCRSPFTIIIDWHCGLLGSDYLRYFSLYFEISWDHKGKTEFQFLGYSFIGNIFFHCF